MIERGLYTSVEVCAGAGGQALGLHRAGFTHLALVESDEDACSTLRRNTVSWAGCEVIQRDLRTLNPQHLAPAAGQLDLLAGGVPCPPFSAAGQQLGADDERDLFPCFLDFTETLRPRAIMIENVRGILSRKFNDYRVQVKRRLSDLGYEVCNWGVVEARRFGVPQLRPRAALIAMRPEYAHYYDGLPRGASVEVTVYDALRESMRERASALRASHSGSPESVHRIDKALATWSEKASSAGKVAPTLVGGSKKHGGADLGPTRAKREWAELGVNGLSLAGGDPASPRELDDFVDQRGVKLTVAQTMIIQGIPADWEIYGRKTAAYRQVGNAFPPPVAEAVGAGVLRALRRADGARGEPAPVSALLQPLGDVLARSSQPALPGC